jgi:hypothetical protein
LTINRSGGRSRLSGYAAGRADSRGGLDFNVTLAPMREFVFGNLLGVALIALVYHSHRSGRDDDAHSMAMRPDIDRHIDRPDGAWHMGAEALASLNGKPATTVSRFSDKG